MSHRFRSLFPTGKPLIAMAHVPPLPGTPMYDEKAGVRGLIDAVAADLAILLEADVDAVMFCNEGDRPYSFSAGYEGVAVMTRIVTQLAPTDRPFGVDFLWDAQAALAIAVATGASFMREVVTGVYESDMGLWKTDVGRLLRDRRRLDAEDVAIFMNVTPEFASSFGGRDSAAMARSAAVSSLPDALLVSGPMAGASPDRRTVSAVRDAVPDDVPVLVNTGVTADNVRDFLNVADGVIVGSALKHNGHTWNAVDGERVAKLMETARTAEQDADVAAR